MRKILFRGKTKDTLEWVEGSLMIEKPPLQCFTTDKPEANTYYIGSSGFADWNMTRPWEVKMVEEDSIGEYIGLQDVNKKNIFEGDIYIVPGGGGKIKYLVSFENGAFVGGREEYSPLGWSTEEDSYELEEEDFASEVEVIGNIFDNPELLNFKK